MPGLLTSPRRVKDCDFAASDATHKSTASYFCSSLMLAALLLNAPVALFAQNIATTGTLAVDKNGAANLVVPISVPPGRGGLTPTLTFSYSSQLSRGLLGVGGSLSGLPTIKSCPQTLSQDGQRRGVTYTLSDRYCLDGERLIAINGLDGVDGTEYRTESESFSRIYSYGTNNVLYTSGSAVSGGPAWFQVQTKDGLTMEFGHSDDSQFVPPNSSPGQTVRAWALNKVSDKYGNYYTVQYSNVGYTLPTGATTDYGIFYPVRLDYGMNENASGGTSPVYSLLFRYSALIDTAPKFTVYQGGYPQSSDRVLSSIGLIRGSLQLRSYRVNYLPTPSGGTYDDVRISSFQECLEPATQCLDPIQLTWPSVPADTGFDLAGSTSGFPGAGTDYLSYFVDLDGGGKKYWIQIRKSANETWLGSADAAGAFGASQWVQLPATVGGADLYDHYFADVDGDGKADWIRVSKATNEAWIALGRGRGQFDFWTKHVTAVGAGNQYAHFFADLNGDGKADWIQVNRSADDASVALATSAGDFNFWTSRIATNVAGNKWTHSFADVNGDGKADWIRTSQTTGTIAYLSNGDGTFASKSLSQASPTAPHFFTDMNADGIADFVEVVPGDDSSGVPWKLRVSLGTGGSNAFAKAGDLTTTASTTHFFADYDGDGAADWIQIVESANNAAPMMRICPSRPSLPSSSCFWANQGASFRSVNDIAYYFADVNGDGKADRIDVDKVTNAATVHLSTAQRAERVTSIQWPLGKTTRITYKDLSDPSVYTPDSGAQYPDRDVTSAAIAPYVSPLAGIAPRLAVVAAVTEQAGSQADRTTTYTYAGLRGNVQGRGLLGFRMTKAVQQTGNAIVTNRRQDWPYTGLVASMTTTAPGGTELSNTINTFGCTDFVSTTGCSVAPRRRYFVYLSQSSTTAHDLNGALLPSTTRSAIYDGFGNLTHVVESSSDGRSVTTDTDYLNNTSTWIIGRPVRSTTARSGQ